MLSKVSILIFLLFKIVSSAVDLNQSELSFKGSLNLQGEAELGSDGLFRVTGTTTYGIGRIFYNFPTQFKNSTNSSASSFSTTFVFAIMPPKYPRLSGDGLAFTISARKDIPGGSAGGYFGLFNASKGHSTSNHIIAVELDTVQNIELRDIDDNHIGIDINSLISVKSASAGYFDKYGGFKNLTLESGELQVWIDYNGDMKQLNVTLHPIHMAKPKQPLLSLNCDLSLYLNEFMYVGFSSSTGFLSSSHYILGWTFKINGEAATIDLSRLPKVRRHPHGSEGFQRLGKFLAISLSLSVFTLVLILAFGFFLFIKRKRFKEVLEDWEVQYGPLKFSYKDLSIATHGFAEKQLLGKGGFGKVYRGMLPQLNREVAVKRISHDTSQGIREFVAEIATIGRLRHPNLVRLLGYNRHKGELYLVYDIMPNGSLDKFLYQTPNQTLDWNQRFKIIKDAASALLYLHQKWVQVVIHRDIKPANVLIPTSRIAGTLGYISPELARTGKASTNSDVFSFGNLMLEITCGRRPILPRRSLNETVLVDWVLDCWDNGGILDAVDARLGCAYLGEQVDMVLKLGLLCTYPLPATRPSMSTVMQFLDGVAKLPDNLFDILSIKKNLLDILKMTGGASSSSDPAYVLQTKNSTPSMTLTESFQSHGR